MRFAALIAGALAVVGPASAKSIPRSAPKPESVTASYFYFTRAADGTVTNLQIYLQGDATKGKKVYCYVEKPQWPEPYGGAYQCDDPDFTFAVHASTNPMRLRVYHSVGDSGYWGQAYVDVGCSKEGNCRGGPNKQYFSNIPMVLNYGDPPNYP